MKTALQQYRDTLAQIRAEGTYKDERIITTPQHARIDTTKAKAIAGVEAVVTFEEMRKPKSWAGYMYLTGRIRYAGDAVAMVATEQGPGGSGAGSNRGRI